MRWATAVLVCLPLCWISTPSLSADISGAWKVETRGGPVPLCNLVQEDNDLYGWCVGPVATGTVIGTVVGPTVRWHWQWVTYSGSAAAAFDFSGTLGADNTITGMVERREIGMLLNFTAKRQSTTSQELPAPPLRTRNANNEISLDDHGPGRVACDGRWFELHQPASGYQKFLQSCMKDIATVNGLPNVKPPAGNNWGLGDDAQPVISTPTQAQHVNNSLQEAHDYYYTKGPSPAVIASARLISPDLAELSDAQIKRRLIPDFTREGVQRGDWVDAVSKVSIPGPGPRRSLEDAWNTIEQLSNEGDAGIDPQIIARANKLYPRASQENERTKYITDEMNAAADRQQGNSYSIRVR